MARSQINIRLNSTTGRQIETLAAQTGMSKTTIITTAVDRYYREEIRTMAQLSLEEQARRRVNNTPGLKAIENIIFYDWPNWDEHMLWVVLSPVETIIDWAQTVNTDA